VRLDLANAAAVAMAFDDLQCRLGPGPALVQRQAKSGIELIIGARRDASFGPVVMVGLGGVWVEALADVVLRLAPVEVEDVPAMIDELKAAPILAGFRGRPGVDRDTLARLVCAISHLIAAAPWLDEFEANPVISNERGLVIVDARMRLVRT
jgi:acyl-CoA synthetase (NDP forming)